MKDFEDKKASRKERKQIQGQDRSKYKKSVRQKHEQKREGESDLRIADQKLMRGRVISIYSDRILVDSEGKTIICTLRGVLKKEFLEIKNLVVVGDFVLFAELALGEGSIWQIEKRHSSLAKASKSGKQEQLIAANLDQVIIVTATQDPPFDLNYVDRAMIATLRGAMQPLLVINKIDLGIPPLVQEIIALFTSLHIPVFQTSIKNGIGIDLLKSKMQGKASVFAGLSGAGKSSLINEIVGLDLVTQEVSEKSKRGRHTTTRSSLLRLPFGGFCVDTPGIQNFGILNISKEDIDRYFTDIVEKGKECKFINCSHSHEPGCAVKEACQKGELSPLRLLSYQEF